MRVSPRDRRAELFRVIRHSPDVMAAGEPWVVIQHVAHEGPGAVALAVADSGGPLQVVRVDRGEAVPDARWPWTPWRGWW